MIVEIDRERAIELIEKCARFIAERHLGAAAIMAIESLKPLNFIGSQLLYTISPFAEVFFDPKEYQEIAALLEQREYVELLIRRIDELDDEMHREEREKKRMLRKRKRTKRKEKFAEFKKKILKKKE
ncbi:MAG: hypothetical protein K0B81_05780 [Candidatus Cloacimonetes bacterium]|nr:hypothetical protein [Candidatus Cloacimonadota bacterium]